MSLSNFFVKAASHPSRGGWPLRSKASEPKGKNPQKAGKKRSTRSSVVEVNKIFEVSKAAPAKKKSTEKTVADRDMT